MKLGSAIQVYTLLPTHSTSLGVELANGPYHVTARGDPRKDIHSFYNERNKFPDDQLHTREYSFGVQRIPGPRPSYGRPTGHSKTVMRGRRQEMSEYTKAATVDEIPEEGCKVVELGGKSLALFQVGGEFYAIDNTCTHDGGPLGEGELEGHEVTCPWHGAIFDITTGAAVGPPAGDDVDTYPVRVNGPDVEVQV